MEARLHQSELKAEMRRTETEAERRVVASASAMEAARLEATRVAREEMAAREAAQARELESRRVAEQARLEAANAMAEAREAQQAAARRAEECASETNKLRAAQLEANKWFRVHQGWVREAEAARRGESDAKDRQVAASETARGLAHDLLSYHSKGTSHSWETQARKKALQALSDSPSSATGAERQLHSSPSAFDTSSTSPSLMGRLSGPHSARGTEPEKPGSSSEHSGTPRSAYLG